MSLNVLIEGLLPAGGCFNLVSTNPTPVPVLKDQIYQRHHIFPADYFLTSNGSVLDDNDYISATGSFLVVRAHLPLLGGKGGFGTLIRSMGTQRNKGASKGASRDLSGRRMRDVEKEKKMAKWVSEEPERRKKLMEEKKQKLERRRVTPKHYFNDPTYMEQIRSTEDNIDTALQQGLQAASTTTEHKASKRKLQEEAPSTSTKKQKFWLGVDEEHSDVESESDDDECRKETEGEEEMNNITEHRSEAQVDEIKDRIGQTEGEHSETQVDIGLEDSNSIGSANKTDQPPTTHHEDAPSDQPPTTHHEDAPSDEPPTTQRSEDVPPDDHRNQKLGDSGTNSVDSTDSKCDHSAASNQRSDTDLEVINIDDFSTVESLMAVSGDVLKHTLQSMGLKCGGTVAERAQRLFSIRGKSKDEIDPSLFAKSKKKQKHNK